MQCFCVNIILNHSDFFFFFFGQMNFGPQRPDGYAFVSVILWTKQEFFCVNPVFWVTISLGIQSILMVKGNGASHFLVNLLASLIFFVKFWCVFASRPIKMGDDNQSVHLATPLFVWGWVLEHKRRKALCHTDCFMSNLICHINATCFSSTKRKKNDSF